MRKWMALFAVAALVAGCSAEKFVTPEEKANMTTVMEKGSPVHDVLTIGDVEGNTTVEANIPQELRGVNLKVEELSTRSREVVTMATATVKPPYPESLEVRVVIHCKKQFRERPVAVRGTVYRELDNADREAVGTFQTVLGSNAVRYQEKDWLTEPPLQFSADALAGLDTAPETMLVYAEVEVVLTAEGTDEATLDPATATPPIPADASVMSSNPLRINFEGVGTAP